MVENKLRWASLISGSGTTMETVAKSTKEGELKNLVQPVVVIASREGIAGIHRAQNLDIPVETVLRKNYPKGLEGVNPYGQALKKTLAKYHPDIVTLNGFLCLVSEEVIYAYQNLIFNQHPGPPEFGGQGMYGRTVHHAVILFCQKLKKTPTTELIAQKVHPQYDQGQIVCHQFVNFSEKDNADSLQQKTLPIEYQIQIDLLKNAANNVLQEIPRDPFVNSTDNDTLTWAICEAKKLYPYG